MRAAFMVRSTTRVAWPPVSSTRRTWEPQSLSWYDRTADPDIGAEYSASIPARVADAALDLPPDIAAQLTTAEEALRQFDASMSRDLSPYASLLLRSEAASSSQIENLTASARSILTAELGESQRRNAQLIVQNTAAMREAFGSVEVSETSILRTHAILLADEPSQTPGALRREPVWIGTSSRSPIGAEYVAPPAELVGEAINDLVQFATRDDLPPLAHAALVHAQFETIHPFTDGNGRTGRALLQTMLRRRGLTEHAPVPVSAGLLREVDLYFDSLSAFRAGDAALLLTMTANAVHVALDLGRDLVADLARIRAHAAASLTVRRGSGTWDALELAIRRPVLTAKVVAQELGKSQANVYRLLDPLLESGFLVESASEVSRARLYRAPDVLSALDRFAERAARRNPAR